MPFLRICDNGAENCEVHAVASCRMYPLPQMKNDFCLVQYYDIVSSEPLEMDDIDKCLNC